MNEKKTGKSARVLLSAALLVAISCAHTPDHSQPRKKLKVFISVDMEGVAGVVHGSDVTGGGQDYELFRELMTLETNAAIEGAVAAGATEILVRDGHGSARNILPHLLDKRARLFRDWNSGPFTMMAGIDETFDAVLFIGYHAKAGTENAPLAHTINGGRIADLSINGLSLPEAGLNALEAGLFDVPVAFLSGGRAICEQAKELLGEIDTFEVKEGYGKANLGLHPVVVQDGIRDGVQQALEQLDRFKPFKLDPPYTLVLKLKKEDSIKEGLEYPGVTQTGEMELSYTSDDLIEVAKAFAKMY